MAPTTGFEDSGGASWTTLLEEDTFLATVADETDAVLSQVGTSVDGSPIWRIDIGAPTGPTWMVVGNQHGDEPAGREAALQHVRNLAYSTDPGVLDYLAANRIVYMPNSNPDATDPQSHTNANGRDVNRDQWDLGQPESRAIQEVFSSAMPSVLADLHERDAVQLGTQMLWRRPELEVLYSGIGTVGDDLISILTTAFDGQGISNGLYPTPGRQSLREAAGLRHAVGMLLETDAVNDSRTDRVSFHLLALETIRTWHGSNTSTLATMEAQSRTYQATTSDVYHLQTGNFGTVPWAGEDLPAALVGYFLTGGATPAAFPVYGVTVSFGNVVALSQESRAIIPILLDPDSGDIEASATRLTMLPVPAEAATVQEFAPVVAGSHRMVVEARIMTRFQVGNNPSGTEIDVLGGRVTFDATADVFASLDLTTSGMDERRRSRFPRRASDLLAPYGHEVFIRRGVDLGPSIMWSPLGYFRLDDDEQSPASDSPIRLTGQDRMSGIVDGDLVIPRQYGRDRTFGEVVADLVTDIYPGAVILFDDDSGQDAIGRQLLVEKDRYAALLDLAESLGKIVYWDGEGILRIEDAPAPDEVVWHIKSGHLGVLFEETRRISREGMANGIVARGEGGDTLAPVQAVAVDAGPQSPTRWFPPDDPDELWFGQVPDEYSSPLITSGTQAENAALAQLRRRIGMPYSVDWGSVVNPALRPRQVVRMTHKDGTRERHEVETLTVPLRFAQPMTGTTREKTLVRLALVDPFVLSGGA